MPFIWTTFYPSRMTALARGGPVDERTWFSSCDSVERGCFRGLPWLGFVSCWDDRMLVAELCSPTCLWYAAYLVYLYQHLRVLFGLCYRRRLRRKVGYPDLLFTICAAFLSLSPCNTIPGAAHCAASPSLCCLSSLSNCCILPVTV
jgi:hypothetical protein